MCTTYKTADTTGRVDKGFSDDNLAIHACPSKQSICGKEQYINFNSTFTTKQINITAGLTQTESCTFLIKSECGAPAFSVAPGNTLLSTHAKVAVMEWDGNKVNYSSLTVTNTNNYATWPVETTVTSNSDDQSLYIPTTLGPRK
jgi:hypothetical protein